MTNPKVLVIGDVMLDKYSFGHINRQSPEDSSVPVFDITYEHSFLGGAGNVAKNLSALGVDVDISCLANQELISLFNEWDIGFGQWSTSTDEVIEKNRMINLSNGKQVFRIDNRTQYEEKDLVYYNNFMKDSINLGMRNLTKYDAIIFSDYCKGIVNRELVETIRKQYKGQFFVDTKKPECDYWVYPNMLVKINNKECKRLLANRSVNDLQRLIVTLGPNGCIYYKNRSECKHEPTTPIYEVSGDVIGAGDCFLAGLVKKWLETKSISRSLAFANKVASKSVEKSGTSTVTLEEVSE